MRRLLERGLALLGPATNRVSLAEKLASVIGGFAGILGIYLVSAAVVGEQGAAWMVASMGASAVLLFGVPHGPLSQPWPLLGGHFISAAIGVACAQWIPQPALAAAVAVGLALGAMHALRCVHPPGGATALTAVIGGPAVTALGFGYVLVPVMLNAGLILVLAILVNYPFAWRRYPVGLMPYRQQDASAPVDNADIQHALQGMNIIVDVTPDELREIMARAAEHHAKAAIHLDLGARAVRADEGSVHKRHLTDESLPACRVSLNVTGKQDPYG